MTYDEIDAAILRIRLRIFGGFHPDMSDDVPDNCRTLLMLGPNEPGFWDHVSAQPEIGDGRPDPLDRWSRRAVEPIAAALGAVPLFPFGGPPWLPFYSWALRTGRCWQSPIRFLVHDVAGLFVSYRAALAFREKIVLPAPSSNSPCMDCEDQPCRQACPVGVLTESLYDSEGCKAYIASAAGADCLETGCNVRRSCPVSAGYGRSHRQSRFHQIAFINR